VIAPLLAAAALAVEPVQPRLLAARGGSIVRVTPDGSGSRTLLEGSDAAWSPDGTLVAFVRGRRLWIANADGTGARRLVATPGAAELEPAWSPNGRLIVYTAVVDDARRLAVVEPDGTGARRIAASTGEEWSPAFSPDGRRLAFVSSRDGPDEIVLARVDGTGAAPLQPTTPPPPDQPPVGIRELAWSPDVTSLAYTAEDETGSSSIAVTRLDGSAPAILAAPTPQQDEHPVWSPDGQRLAFDTLREDAVRELKLVNPDGTELASIGVGAALDWRRVPLGQPLFPDLFQRPPSGLTVTAARGRFLLGFTSLVDNRGPGILWIHAFRPLGSPLMEASQLVRLRGGGARIVHGAGLLHYTVAPPHYHWHLLDFERYELRRADDFTLVVRDRKSGFCIADHYGIAVGIAHGPPRFRGNCAQFHPAARSVEEGSSVGYTDRYPANFHGQNLDVTHVAPGLYWIVHRANSDLLLRERSYGNDVASLLVRITWPNGRRAAPHVRPLRACFAERC